MIEEKGDTSEELILKVSTKRYATSIPISLAEQFAWSPMSSTNRMLH
jgi:hypothetical protein